MNIEELAQIIGLLKQHDVTEFEIDQDGTHIKLTRGAGGQFVATQSVARPVELQPAITGAVNGQVAAAATVSSDKVEHAAHLIKVESPIVGTFYRKPSPEADPFSKEGDRVSKGDTLCIIEAMKLMNEIESPADGRVEKILLNDGQVAEYGEVLFLINPNG